MTQELRRFRVETDDGSEREVRAAGYDALFADLDSQGYPLKRVTHIDYWSVPMACWVSADDLLAALGDGGRMLCPPESQAN